MKFLCGIFSGHKRDKLYFFQLGFTNEWFGLSYVSKKFYFIRVYSYYLISSTKDGILFICCYLSCGLFILVSLSNKTAAQLC